MLKNGKELSFMKKIRFSLTRMTAMLLVLVCMLGLLPATALAANPSSIKMEDCTHNGVSYVSPSLGTCYLHQMTFDYNKQSTIGFCAEKLSSNKNTFGFFAIALAMESRCFCPPDTLVPPCEIGL